MGPKMKKKKKKKVLEFCSEYQYYFIKQDVNALFARTLVFDTIVNRSEHIFSINFIVNYDISYEYLHNLCRICSYVLIFVQP